MCLRATKMLQPNWLDKSIDLGERATAEQYLAEIAKAPKAVECVAKALAEHDKANADKPIMGPSRSQVVRRALAEVLMSAD